MRPIALKPSDKVAVVAPSGPFDKESFEKGLRLISQRYQPVFGEGLFSQHRYLAGTDERRFLELQAAFSDDSIKGIFAARGGYGAMRLLDRLSFSSPKVLVGFSDITALHAAANTKRFPSIHGPVLTQLGKQSDAVVNRLFHLLENASPAPSMTGECVVPGMAEGTLLGGNLSVFTRLLGTPYMPPLEKAVLLLEDVTERPYRLDRMWTHLKLAGVFQKVSGIVLGDFTQCDEPNGGLTAFDVLKTLAIETGLPCAWKFPIGHGDINVPVPLGTRVRLDATSGTLEFLEPVVTPGASS